jgi:ankyrin repeat protein
MSNKLEDESAINSSIMEESKVDLMTQMVIDIPAKEKSDTKKIKLSKIINENAIDPITKQIIKDGVIASDGCLYERVTIEKWLKKNNTSPVTMEKLKSKKLYPCYPMKSMVDAFLEKYPKEKENQYVMHHADYVDNVNNFIKNGEFNKLLLYEHFDMSKMKMKQILFKKASNEVIKHVINHCDNLDWIDKNNQNLLHYATKRSTVDVVKLLIDKGINLECRTKIDEWTPIYYAIKNNSFETVKLLIEKGVNLECEDKKKNASNSSSNQT